MSNNQSVTVVSGLGEAAAKVLAEHGISTLADLRASSVESLSQIPGFGAKRAERILAAAAAVPADDPASTEGQAGEGGSSEEGQGDKPSKKKGKKDKSKKKSAGKKRRK